MPRSADGRWTATCKQCGKTFQQLRKGQEYCSQACSNKASPGIGGRKPARGVPPRRCAACGEVFQPYRYDQDTCSISCYRTTSRYQDSQRRSNARPERQARKNELRRGKQSVRDYNRKRQLAKYGLTPEVHDQMLAEQGGVCAICGNPPKPNGIKAASRLHADHDHVTGRARDLLCLNCNRGLGYFKEDPALLRAAAAYVERHRSAHQA